MNEKIRKDLDTLIEEVAEQSTGWPWYCAELLAIGLRPGADPWKVWQAVTAPSIAQGNSVNLVAALAGAYAAALVDDERRYEKFAKAVRSEFWPHPPPPFGDVPEEGAGAAQEAVCGVVSGGRRR